MVQKPFVRLWIWSSWCKPSVFHLVVWSPLCNTHSHACFWSRTLWLRCLWLWLWLRCWLRSLFCSNVIVKWYGYCQCLSVYKRWWWRLRSCSSATSEWNDLAYHVASGKWHCSSPSESPGMRVSTINPWDETKGSSPYGPWRLQTFNTVRSFGLWLCSSLFHNPSSRVPTKEM